MTEPSVDDYRPEDEPLVLELMRQSLGESELLPRTPSFWRWKHFENPFGPSLLLVARINEQIVGLRAYLRWRFVSPSGTLDAMRAVDTATHPDYQRHGVFRLLTLEANRKAGEAGVDLIFNTPNRKSLPGYLTMGWSLVGKPRTYVRVAHPLRLLRPGHHVGVPDPRTVLPGGANCNFDESFGDRPMLGIRTDRSAGYLQWRFARHPTVAYRSVACENGTAIVRGNHRAGRVEVVVSETLGEPSLRVLRSSVEADYLVGSARPESPEARLFRRGGFLPAPGQGLTLVAKPLTERALFAQNLSSWDLSAGDLELM
jgi:GNAT superfamily N-acetyltransferase